MLLTRRSLRGGHLKVGWVVAALAVGLAGMPVPATATYSGPNGRIALQSFDKGLQRLELYTMDAHGGHRRELTAFANADIESPDWSPDGSVIAFDSDFGGGVHLFTIKDDGTHLTQLTSGDGTEYTPAWSPDASQLALEHVDDSTPDGIFLLDPTSGALSRVTANPFGQFDTNPQYTPDGRMLVFARIKKFISDGALSALFTVNLDGSDLRRLTRWRMNANGPDWSPDGTRIIFNSADDRIQDAEIYVMHADGSRLHRLTNAGRLSSFQPSWSPSGHRIVFTRATIGAHPSFELYTMRADGSDITRLTHNRAFENQADWGSVAAG